MLYRVGKNFFYDSLIYNVEPLGSNFYISAGLFFVLWSWMAVDALLPTPAPKLECGRIESIAATLAEQRLSGGLFPNLEEACRQSELQRVRLEAIGSTVSGLAHEVGAWRSGRPAPRPSQRADCVPAVGSRRTAVKRAAHSARS